MSLKSLYSESPSFNKYGVFFILIIAFVPALITVVTRAYGPVENYGWNILYYHVGYETGFGGRKLLATICHWFFPDFVKLRHIRAMVIAANFLMVGLFVLFMGKCFINKKSSLLPLLILYIIGPFSIITFLSSGLSVAFIETYQITLTLLWLLLWMKYRGKWPFYIATLLIAVTCCLLHHTFCCTLFPLYVGLFVYDIIDKNRVNWKEAIGYCVICTIMLGLLFVIWKFSKMAIDIDQLNEWFKNHVAVNAYECSRDAQNSYYYMSNDENRESMASFFTWERRYGELFWSLVLLSPLIVTLYYPWIRASHTASTKYTSWRYRFVWILVTLLTLPIFFMATDYSRWFVCFFFSLFSITIAAIAIGDRPLRASSSRMLRWFSRHPVVSLALIIYLLGMHCPAFDQTELKFGLSEAVDLWRFLQCVLK